MKYLKYKIILITVLLVEVLQAASVAGGVAGTLTVKNSIIYNDTTYLQIASTVTISNSAIRGRTVPTGTGNKLINNFSAMKDILAAPSDTFSYYLAPTSTLRNAGINISSVPTKDLNGNDRTYDTTIDIGAVEYSQVYQNGTGTWNTATCWNTGRIPTTDDVVTIRSGATVNSTDALCKSIIGIEAGASLTINPEAQLVVSTCLNNTNSDRLIVKSSESQANGTLIFHNTTDNPYATVEMYSKAFCNNKSSTPKSDYKWQFFGIPIEPTKASPTFDGSYVRSWDERKDSTKHWVALTNESILSPFYGYEITQTDAKIIYFKGQLVNRNFSVGPLAITSGASFPGQHIFANPYAAAIKIKKITFGNDADNTVYLYNSGSLADWKINRGSNTTSAYQGQYTAIPQGPAGNLMQSEIPSMQAMLIKPKPYSTSITNYTFALKYDSVVMNNISRQKVAEYKSQSSTEDKTVTLIDVKGSANSDRMWLFTQPGCTHTFDNGWDGVKMMGDALTPQLFAMEPDGNYQVNTVDDVNNTLLGFQAGQDTNYILTFTHQNLKSNYSAMYLYDLVENKTTDITESGSTYSFTAVSTPTPVKRFIIATQKIEKDPTNKDNQLTIFNSGNTVFVKNSVNMSGEINVYDMIGRILTKADIKPLSVSAVQVNAIYGSYIVHAATGKERVSKKILVGK